MQIALEQGLPTSVIMANASHALRRPRGSWRPRLSQQRSRAGQSPGAVADATALGTPPLAHSSILRDQQYLDSVPAEHMNAADSGLVPGA
jgi:hypothetical protein